MRKLFFLTFIVIDVAAFFIIFMVNDGYFARKFFTYDTELYNLTRSYKERLKDSYVAKAKVTYLQEKPDIEVIIKRHVCLSGRMLHQKYGNAQMQKVHSIQPKKIEPPKLIPIKPPPSQSAPSQPPSSQLDITLHPSSLFSLFETIAARGAKVDWDVCGDIIIAKETWGLIEYEDNTGKHKGVLSYMTVSWEGLDNYPINHVHMNPPEVNSEFSVLVNPNDSENVLYGADYFVQAVIKDVPNHENTLRSDSLFQNYKYLYDALDGYWGNKYVAYLVIGIVVLFVGFVGVLVA